MPFLNIIKLSFFKSYILRKRHWFLSILEFVVPVMLFFLMAYGRSKVGNFSQKYIDEPTYAMEISGDQLMAHYFSVGETHIFYTPVTQFTDSLIKETQIKLQLPNDAIKGFGNEDDIMKHYAVNPNGTVIAIIFKSADEDNLDYTIKAHENDIRWETNKLYFDLPVYIPDTGSQTYRNRGVLGLQYALDLSYTELLMKGQNLQFYFEFQEFPYPPYKLDTFLSDTFMHFLPLITILSFISLCPVVLKPIVEEKHSGSKELLKMVGMKPLMIYLGWFLHAFVTTFISVVLIVILMKVSLFGAPYPPIEHCNAFLYFVFLLFYCMASIIFCMLLSTFFSRPSIAMVFGILIWIITYFLPHAVVTNYETLSWKFKMLMSLLPNVALYFGYSEIAVYEMREIGVNFENLATPGSGSKDDLSFSTSLLMFILQIFLYALLTLYLENVNPGCYGIPKKFNYPIRDFIQFLRRRLGKTTVETKEDTESSLHCMEEGIGLQAGIVIKNLCKRYGHNMAVNGLTMNIYENQITVLLGHNGAGKTTTMSIITGMIPATNGSVRINGLDINKDIDRIRKEIGWCPQHNLIFSYFTVFEHLIYFSRLRGWSNSEAEELSMKLMRQLNLESSKDVLACNLSGGMKRKLCLSLALTGKSKVLILDEPTSGMDPESRREVWNLLLKLRGEMTILITTHFMEEADVLGDWISIMANGNYVCYGTPMYLKKKYDTGYHLSLMLQSNDQSIEKAVTKQITTAIQDSCLKYKNANNLVYVLPVNEKSKFPDLFKSLEDLEIENKKVISNMAVNITTLEEVFLRTSGAATTGKEVKQIGMAPRQASMQGQFWALIKKHFWFLKKKWKYQIVPICIAAFMMFLVSYLGNGSGSYYGNSEPEVKFDLSIYGESSVFYESVDNNDMKKYYQQIAESQKGSVFEVPSVVEAIIKKGMDNLAYYKQHMIVAASFTPEKVTIMYSNSAVHGAPISLSMVINAVIRTFVGPGHTITTRFAPLPGISTIVSRNEQSAVQVGIMWLIIVPIAMFFLMGGFLIFPSKEHASKFSALQFMAGVPVWLYWLTNFLFDFGIILISSIVLSLFLLINPAFTGTAEIGTCIVIFLCFGFSSLPYAYLFSFKKSISGAFALLLMTGMFFGIIPTVVVSVMEESQDEWYENLAVTLKYIFLSILPQFGLSYTSVRYSRKVVSNYNWKIMSPKKRMLKCASDAMAINPCCYGDTVECKKHENYFLNDELGLLPDILIELFVPFIIYMSLVMLIDSLYWKKLKQFLGCVIRSINNRGVAHKYTTSLAVVSSAPDDSNRLYVENVSKYFYNKQAVKDVSFAVNGGQCFGLLGVNGAGKTTTFRMLTNDLIYDDGKIGVHGDNKNIGIETKQYFEKIGYCPQYDALNFDLTARELLIVMAQFRNFDEKASERIADDFLDLLDLTKYGVKPCGEFSGGNKRKLSLALALVGCRPYILLDEPTSGVDPVSRRKIWEVIDILKQIKKVSFILTSHSMDECEALCENMAIMKDGTIDAKGSIPDLKQQHGTGFTLKLKLKNKPDSCNADSLNPSVCKQDIDLMEIDEVDGDFLSSDIKRNSSLSSKTSKTKGSAKASSGRTDSGIDEVDGLDDRRMVKYDPLKNGDLTCSSSPDSTRFRELEGRMRELFTFELKDKHEGMLHYHIKGEDRWSQLFNKVEDFKKEFSDIVEDYTISGTSLEDVFLSVAKASKQ